MKRFSVAATLALLVLGACAPQQGPRGPNGRPLRPVANPSEVITAELAFARLAQTKGQWAAFRETAASGAEMFVPQRVKAVDWLKGQAEPAVAVKWQPHAVWSSCDGSYAVTRGGWESPNASGSFATIWQRQNNGAYKWIADMSLTADGPVAAPEMIAARVAECRPAAGAPPLIVMADSDWQMGASKDGTLRWGTGVGRLGSRSIKVLLWTGASYETVLDHSIPTAARAR